MNSGPTAGFIKVTDEDKEYPESLRELADHPSVLYVKGRWPLPDELAIGIVGTRLLTPYGREAARRITADLVDAGAVIISGLAAGIDTCAHEMTLEKRGWTVAVLGHGFGYLFPKENARLFERIAEEGTLVTEFPYDTRPNALNFPQRNRIISGLSRGVAVIEAPKKSGALITARFAAEQGRDVFAVPGSVFSLQSSGCHYLIKEGAKLITSAQDILNEYGFVEAASTPAPSAENDVKDPLERELLTLLSSMPLSVDELAETSGLAVDRLAEVLLSLELKGKIQHLPGQRYVAYN